MSSEMPIAGMSVVELDGGVLAEGAHIAPLLQIGGERDPAAKLK